jgi:hypothetical protein
MYRGKALRLDIIHIAMRLFLLPCGRPSEESYPQWFDNPTSRKNSYQLDLVFSELFGATRCKSDCKFITASNQKNTALANLISLASFWRQ